MSICAQPEGALQASVSRNLLINGEWRPAASGKTFDVEDPAATGKVLLSIADAGPEDGMAALDAAAAAQESRAKVPPAEGLHHRESLVSGTRARFSLTSVHARLGGVVK